MKDIIISNEVKQEISSLVNQLHSLCEANNVPVVVGVILGRTITDRDDSYENINISKSISVFIDSEKGAFDPTIVAAYQILRLRQLPASALYMLERLADTVSKKEAEGI